MLATANVSGRIPCSLRPEDTIRSATLLSHPLLRGTSSHAIPMRSQVHATEIKRLIRSRYCSTIMSYLIKSIELRPSPRTPYYLNNNKLEIRKKERYSQSPNYMRVQSEKLKPYPAWHCSKYPASSADPSGILCFLTRPTILRFCSPSGCHHFRR